MQNASHLEFFHNEALNSAVDALVREDIQNRLDARARNEPFVEVKYRLCGPAPAQSRRSWFNGLQRHIESPQVKEELGYTPSIDRPFSWLVIEDFRTTGLEGDPSTYQDPEQRVGAPRNDFFWFVRNVGRSGKKGGERGRWGLGKIVYPASSKIRSFFAYTVRQSDPRRLLIGRSVLAVHHSARQQHDSEGYFGRFDDRSHEFFATPEVANSELERFKSEFQIARQDDQPGLSLVIPWPDEDITFKGLVWSIVDHWFWVILDGRLQVQVSQDGGPSVCISADTIENVVQTLDGVGSLEAQQVLRKIQFGRTAQTMDPSSTDFHHLLAYPTGSAPKWDKAEERFQDPSSLDSAREAFHAGRLVGFDVPVRVKRVDGTVDEAASFEVYIRKSENGHPPVEVFLREGLSISGQRSLRESGIFAIVKTENDALGSMLGDAENPAHTRWERSGKHFKNKYEYGPSILGYIQRSAVHLCSLLSRRSEGLDRDLLQSLFFVTEPGDLVTPSARPGVGPKPPVVIPPIVPREVFVECKKIDAGFRLRPHPRAVRKPAFIQVRAAYEVVRGNPFNFHHPADFDFSRPKNINLELNGLSVISADPKRLLLSVDAPDFELTATGFDVKRDLVVDVKPLHAEPNTGIDSGTDISTEDQSDL